MPSGKVHDRFTIYTAAAALPAWYLVSAGRDPVSFFVGLAAYLFSGIWLSGDLDTNSSAYKRWGALRLLWWPYRTLVPHRSWLSHGIAVGPLVRALYIALVVWAVAKGLLILIDFLICPVDERSLLGAVVAAVSAFWQTHRHYGGWALGGLILGGVTHSVLDSVVSRTRKAW